MPSLVVPVPLRAEAVETQKAYLASLYAAMPERAVSAEASKALVHPLGFDSECFGVSMGRVIGIEVEPADARSLATSIVDRAGADGIDHLTARVPARDVFLIQALAESGFFVADTHVTLLHSAFEAVEPRPDVEIGLVRADEVDALAAGSEGIYEHSRFFNDGTLDPAGARRLYNRWVRNDCNGRADAVLVARVEGEPAGYIACLWEETHASIDLIAVFPNAQGRGVGSGLVQAALAHYKERTDRMYVETQGGNRQAMRLYGSNGFRFDDLDVTLHWSGRVK